MAAKFHSLIPLLAILLMAMAMAMVMATPSLARRERGAEKKVMPTALPPYEARRITALLPDSRTPPSPRYGDEEAAQLSPLPPFDAEPPCDWGSEDPILGSGPEPPSSNE